MPVFGRKDPEDPRKRPSGEVHAKDAYLRTGVLTQELLEWATTALESVIRTPQFETTASRRVRTSILDAYKYLDYLWPMTAEVRRASVVWELENRDTGVDLAAQERLLAEDHLVEHPYGDGSRTAAEAGRGDSTVGGETHRPQEVWLEEEE